MATKISKVKVKSKKASPRVVQVRHKSAWVRFVAALLPVGILVLAISFAVSLRWSAPLIARAGF